MADSDQNSAIPFKYRVVTPPSAPQGGSAQQTESPRYPEPDFKFRKVEPQVESVSNLEGAGRTVASGLSTGLSELLGAPAALFNLAGSADKAILKKLGYEHNPIVAPDVTGFLQEKASELTKGYTDYEPTTRTGRVVKNVARFVPAAAGAIMTGGLSAPAALGYAAVTPGVTGALAKETGDYLGGERAGNIAQAVTETLSPFGASRIGNALTKVPKKAVSLASDIKNLEGFLGKRVTPASITSNSNIRNEALVREALDPRKNADIRAQNQNFSTKIMEKFGVTDELAAKYGFPGGVVTPENAQSVVQAHLNSVGKEIGDVYGSLTPRPLMIENKGLAPPVATGMPEESNKFLDALTGASGKRTFSPKEIENIKNDIDIYRFGVEQFADDPLQQAHLQADLDDAIARLNNAQTPPIQGGLVPQVGPRNTIDISRVRNLADGFPGMDKYSPNVSIGQYLKNVRTEANQIISGEHGDLGVSFEGRAKALIDYIDSTVKDAIGDKEFARLQSMNEEYSKFKTVDNALDRASRDNRTGMLTPRDVLDSGNTRYTSQMKEAARLADIYLLKNNMVPTPENRKTALRIALGAIGGGLAGAGQFAMMGGNPITAGLAATLGAGTVDVVGAALRAAKNSRVIGNAQRRRALYQPVNPIDVTAGPAATAAIQEEPRQERKSGGRVGSHDAEADRLVMAAERAKRGLSAHTEGLLNTSDDSVASALEIANRSI